LAAAEHKPEWSLVILVCLTVTLCLQWYNWSIFNNSTGAFKRDQINDSIDYIHIVIGAKIKTARAVWDNVTAFGTRDVAKSGI